MSATAAAVISSGAPVMLTPNTNEAFDFIADYEQNLLPQFFDRLRNNDPAPATPLDVATFINFTSTYNCCFTDPLQHKNKDSVFVNIGQLCNNSLVLSAVEGSNQPALDYIVRQLGCNPDLAYDAQVAFKTTPLITAIRMGNVRAVETLLADKRTTRNLVVSGENPEDELQLLFRKKDPAASAIAALLFTPVQAAAQASEEEQEEALSCSSDLNGANPAKFARLKQLCEQYPHIVNDPIGLEDTENMYTTLLYSAARANNHAAAAYLLGAGADPNKVVTGQNTPLHVACYRGHVGIVRLLVATKHADTLAVNSLGETCTTCFKDGLPAARVQEIMALVQLPLIEELQGWLRRKHFTQAEAERVKRMLKAVPVDMIIDGAVPGSAAPVAGGAAAAPQHTTMLNEAVRYQVLPAAELLLQYGADPNGVNHAGYHGPSPVLEPVSPAVGAVSPVGRGTVVDQSIPVGGRFGAAIAAGAVAATPYVPVVGPEASGRFGPGGVAAGGFRGAQPATEGRFAVASADRFTLPGRFSAAGTVGAAAGGAAAGVPNRFTVAAAAGVAPSAAAAAPGGAVPTGVFFSDPSIDLSMIPSPLFLAYQAQNIAMAKLLFSFGAKPELLTLPEHIPAKLWCELHAADKKPEQLAFLYVIDPANAQKVWLEEFVQNPGALTVNTPLPLNDPAPLPLLCHSILCNNVDAFDVLINSGKADLGVTHPAEGDTLLMMAACMGNEHCVRVMLQQGNAPDAVNRKGKTPLELAATAGTKKLIQDALDRLAQEKLNAIIQQFCDSLPQRFDPAAPHVRVVAGSFARTPEGALGAIAATLVKAIDAYQGSFRTFGVNPVCGLLAGRLANLVMRQNHQDTFTKDKFESVFLRLPPTQLFPFALQDMYAQQLQRAWNGDAANMKNEPPIPAFVLSAFKGGTQERADIEAACKTTTNAPKPTVEAAFKCAKELSDAAIRCVVGQWTKMCEWQARLSFTFMMRVAIPAVQKAWNESPQLPAKWGEAMNPQANRVTELVEVRDADVRGFLAAVTAEWARIPVLAQVLAPPVQRIAASQVAPEKKLELAEREIEKSLDSIAKALGEEARTTPVPEIPRDEVNGVSMKKLFSELVPEELSTAWVRLAGPASQQAAQQPPAAGAPAATATNDLYEGYFPIPPSELQPEVAINAARQLPLLARLRDGLIKQMPHGTTKQSQDRFVAESKRIIDAAAPSMARPVAPGADPRPALAELYNMVIRPLHLNGVWRHMPMYAHGGEIDAALAKSDVLLVHAGTGSGKSVFMPQHLAHNLPASMRVVVTQPRRLPVKCIGDRVRDLFGETHCGYQVGGGSNPCERANLQFRTDALFLNDVFNGGDHLSNTIVIIDEVHERSPVIDLLLLGVCHHIAAGTAKNVKLILASATVQSTFFKESVATFKRAGGATPLTFGGVEVDVQCPYPVTTIPNPTYFQFPDSKMPQGTKMWEVRPKKAADDAKEIISASSNSKVLCFLPNIGEVEAAKDRFNMLCNNNVPCLALHGRTEGAEGKVQTVRVVFANKIAETSITVPGLTHVLDFNLDMISEVDGELNSRTLKLELATKAAQKQRYGRLGRVGPGQYKCYYDPSTLPEQHPVSFDTLPNEALLQQEVRVRHYFGRTLFVGIQGLQPLGKGIPVRKGLERCFPYVPTNAGDLKLAATLSMTPNMFHCFNYAIKKGKCPLALLWLSAMIESREPVTRSGKIEAHHCVKFGGNGDQGVLLDVYNLFEDARRDFESRNPGKKFEGAEIRKWCDAEAAASAKAAAAAAAAAASTTSGGGGNAAAASAAAAPAMPGAAAAASAAASAGAGGGAGGGGASAATGFAPKSSPLNMHWYENVHHRIGVVTAILSGPAFGIDVSKWGGYAQWTWDDIEDALLAGYAANVAVNVKTNVGDRPTQFYNLYHHLGVRQQTGLDIFNTSLLHNGPVKALPDYCLFSLIERRGAKGFMKYCTSVSEERFNEHTKGVTIQHSIGMVGAQINAYDKFFKAKTYPNVTVERTPANFTQDLKERSANGFQYMRAEFVARGTPVQVAQALAAVASDLYDAENNIATLPPVKNVPAIDAFGMPPATFKHLEKFDRMLAARFKKATDPARTDADLKACIHGSDDMERALAVCNVVVNVLKLVVKGGFVRDIVVRGMTNFKDFDCECVDKNAIQQATMMKTLEEWRDTLARRFGLKFSKPMPRKSLSPTGDGIVELVSGQLELEIVMPWNSGMIPVQNMDFSCNNLRIEPGANELRQSFPIMMTTMDIVAELRASPSRTSCTRDALWQPVPSGKKGEGYWGNKWLDASSSGMQARVTKFRTKGFAFVESCIIDPAKGLVRLFHGTGKDAANAICKDPNKPDFRPSTTGNLGPGLYVTRAMEVCSTFAKCHNGPCLIECTIDIGNLLMLAAKDMNWQTTTPGYDAAFLSFENSWRNWEEWCIPDVKRVVHAYVAKKL